MVDLERGVGAKRGETSGWLDTYIEDIHSAQRYTLLAFTLTLPNFERTLALKYKNTR